ncbi:MAG TPA: endo-alpha-N-acetylgalactosaminidase family protein [Puia sp.]|nr:endo-alpha-N-acetylgalactosaminidase family protein [Puia sp.]
MMRFSAGRLLPGESIKIVYFLFLFLLWSGNATLFAQHPDYGTYTLENSSIKVVLDAKVPAVKEYLLKQNKAVLYGNMGSGSPAILFYKEASPVYRLMTNIEYTPEYDERRVVYHAKVSYENQPAIFFDLTYRLVNNKVEITFGHVVEEKNYYLLNVSLPSLVSVPAGEGKLVIPANAGRLIDVGLASMKGYEFAIDWVNPVLTCMAYNSKLLAVVDTRSIENHSAVSIFERGGRKYGVISMRFIHRLNTYDLPEFGTVITANDPRFFLKVQDSCTASISLTTDLDKDGKTDWVDGAKLVRQEINATPNPYYNHKTFVRTFLARKGGHGEDLSFDQVLDRIKQFAVQTDSAACVMYLLGWQYSGHDSGYPSIDSVNHELGGYDKLVHLITEARKYNVNVTFYDNYDDSYPTHPGWDSDVICRDPKGDLMRGGAWDGEQSYLISSYKYAVKSGLDRIRRTLEKYPVREAYFIDVLAGGYHGGRKYDFNPATPAGAKKNFEGKKMIISEFNRHGLDVATEDFTGFFVGYAGSFGDIVALDDIYFNGERQIPLIPFIYHGKTSFGMKTSSPSQYARTFLYGQRAQKFTNLRLRYTPADYILDALPKQFLYGKSMKSYQRNGDAEQVVYEDGTSVEANVKADTYSVTTADGEIIAKNYSSFVPENRNAYWACSKKTGAWSYRLPRYWSNREKITVYKLDSAGEKDSIRFTIQNGILSFPAIESVPYKIMYAGQ